MSTSRFNWRHLGLPVYLVLALLVIIGVILVGVLVVLRPAAETGAEPVSTVSYRARVDALLADAHPEDAEAVLEKYGCAACHRAAEHDIAPSWVGVAERAANRRPPMPADAYLYESIVYPGAYIVEDYPDSMPKNFRDRLSDQELGDVIAYLLTPDAH